MVESLPSSIHQYDISWINDQTMNVDADSISFGDNLYCHLKNWSGCLTTKELNALMILKSVQRSYIIFNISAPLVAKIIHGPIQSANISDFWAKHLAWKKRHWYRQNLSKHLTHIYDWVERHVLLPFVYSRWWKIWLHEGIVRQWHQACW